MPNRETSSPLQGVHYQLVQEIMIPAIAIRGLTKDFRVSGSGKWLRAVDDLSLDIERNSIYGLLGPNGSGKSTTIKIVLGLVQPSIGNCEILGISSSNPAARVNVGYLPEAPYFQRFLTGRELLRYFGQLSGVPKEKIRERIDYLLNKVGLEDAGDRRVGGYSKGMLQRIGLAQALIGDPELLVLDEPTAGVDPVGASEIASLIVQLKEEGKTVLLCSHLLSQVESVCDRVAILGQGRLLREGRIESLTKREDPSSIRIDGVSKALKESIERLAQEHGGAVSTPSRSLEELFLGLAKKKEEE